MGKTTARSRPTREPKDAGTLTRGIRLLDILGSHPDGIRLTELAGEAGIPVSTAHRLLAILVAHEFVAYDPESRLYALGLRLFELSHRIARVKGLSEVALPVMKALADTAANMVSLDILDGTEMVVIERVDGPQRIRIGAPIGSRSPAFATASGKAVLAVLSGAERDAVLARLKLCAITSKTITDSDALRRDLEEVRSRGFAFADEENEKGVRASGAPILSVGQGAMAGLSIAAPAFTQSKRSLLKLAPVLKAAAEQISGHLPRR